MTANDLRTLLRTAELDAQQHLVETARRFANEAGIRNARAGLTDALNDMEEAQADYRVAQDAERTARETLDNAEWDAGYEVDARIVREGNKTFWLTDEDETETVPDEQPGYPGVNYAKTVKTGRKVRVQVTADEARERKARALSEVDAVRKATTALRQAEHATAAAKDAVGLAEKRFSAARLEVQAAVAQLQLLGLVLTTNEKAEA